MVPEMLGRLAWGAGKLAMKYVVIPIAVTAATAFVLGGLVERVRRQKEPNGVHNVHEFQSHLEA
ncbi:MAG: hypothetical protein V4510_11830 [bacterium]